tara:strand:+ start:107 stop:961 length:855 start_codon:yes stop_codon:yes gene_type:complete
MSSKKGSTPKASNNKVSSSNNSKNSNKNNSNNSNNKTSSNKNNSNKTSNDVITKTFEDTSKNVEKTLEKNPHMVIILNLVLVLYILAIKNLSDDFLNMLDSMLFKVIMAIVVLLLSFSEPVSAILLTTAFVLSINELNNRNAKNSFQNTNEIIVAEESNQLNDGETSKAFNLENMNNGGCVGDYASGDLTDRKCFMEVTQEKDHLLENTVVKEESQNLSDNTLLENLALEDNKFRQLNSIGMNLVPTSNQNTAPQFLGNGLNSQGLTESIPGGFNSSDNKYSSF